VVFMGTSPLVPQRNLIVPRFPLEFFQGKGSIVRRSNDETGRTPGAVAEHSGCGDVPSRDAASDSSRSSVGSVLNVVGVLRLCRVV
jgi:hypothetical protein